MKNAFLTQASYQPELHPFFNSTFAVLHSTFLAP